MVMDLVGDRLRMNVILEAILFGSLDVSIKPLTLRARIK